MAQARAHGAQPRAALGDRLREPPAAAGPGPRRRTSTSSPAARACTSRRRRSTPRPATCTLGADTRGRPLGVRARQRARTSGGPRSRGTARRSPSRRARRASDPLAIYTMNADGTAARSRRTSPTHDADEQRPARARLRPGVQPPGADGVERIVFASTRGNLDAERLRLHRARSARPRTRPSRTRTSTSSSRTRAPRARTASASSPGSSTWSGCRASCRTGGSSSRPRSASRASTSSRSAGRTSTAATTTRSTRSAAASATTQATYVVELADKDFADDLQQPATPRTAPARSASSTGRSASTSRAPTPSDYPVDPTRHRSELAVVARAGLLPALAARSLRDRRLVHEPVAAARRQDARQLRHRRRLRRFGGDYDVYVLDPGTGAKTKLLGDAGTAEVEAVAVYARDRQGHLRVRAGRAERAHVRSTRASPSADVTVLDMTRPRVAPLPEHADGARRRARPAELRRLRGPAARRRRASPRVRRQHRVRRVRQGLRAAAPARHRARSRPTARRTFASPAACPSSCTSRTTASRSSCNLPRWQREEMTFVPGEYAHQAFPAGFFDNLCAGCHGSISGRPVDAALKPDFLTQASARRCRGARPPTRLLRPAASARPVDRGRPSTRDRAASAAVDEGVTRRAVSRHIAAAMRVPRLASSSLSALALPRRRARLPRLRRRAPPAVAPPPTATTARRVVDRLTAVPRCTTRTSRGPTKRRSIARCRPATTSTSSPAAAG